MVVVESVLKISWKNAGGMIIATMTLMVAQRDTFVLNGGPMKKSGLFKLQAIVFVSLTNYSLPTCEIVMYAYSHVLICDNIMCNYIAYCAMYNASW